MLIEKLKSLEKKYFSEEYLPFKTLTIGIIAGFGMVVGMQINNDIKNYASKFYRPRVVQEVKINDPSEKYLIIEYGTGDYAVMVREKPGEPFKNLDDIQTEINEGIVQKLNK